MTFHNETMGGVTRELSTLFWNRLQSTHFDGYAEMVPLLTPKHKNLYCIGQDLISSLGQDLISWLYVNWPLCISLACAMYLICGGMQVSDKALIC